MSTTPSDFRFESAPDLPGSDRAARVFMSACRFLLDRLYDFRVEGREHVPLEGRAILTPNHLSFCDSLFVPASLPRRVWAIGKGEYLDDWKTKHLFPALGMIPVDRSGGAASQVALDTAATVLEGDHLFLIYPEGTRSRSGFLHKGRTGAARLSLRCDAPVVPVGHIGTLDIQPPDQFTMKVNKPVLVRFGPPMHIRDFGRDDDPRVLRRFTDALMAEIAGLSGQEYVDQYASKDDAPGLVAPSPEPAVTVPKGRRRPEVSVGSERGAGPASRVDGPRLAAG